VNTHKYQALWQPPNCFSPTVWAHNDPAHKHTINSTSLTLAVKMCNKWAPVCLSVRHSCLILPHNFQQFTCLLEHGIYGIGTEENGPEKILLQEFEATWRVKCGKLQESNREQRRPHNFLYSRIWYRKLSTFSECISIAISKPCKVGFQLNSFSLSIGDPRHRIATNQSFLVIFRTSSKQCP
jgi:hypothetical protein